MRYSESRKITHRHSFCSIMLQIKNEYELFICKAAVLWHCRIQASQYNVNGFSSIHLKLHSLITSGLLTICCYFKNKFYGHKLLANTHVHAPNWANCNSGISIFKNITSVKRQANKAVEEESHLFEPPAERLELAEDVELWEVERFLAGRLFHALLGALEGVLVGTVEVEAVVNAIDNHDAVLVPDTEQSLLRQVAFARLHHLIGHLQSRENQRATMHLSVTLKECQGEVHNLNQVVHCSTKCLKWK